MSRAYRADCVNWYAGEIEKRQANSVFLRSDTVECPERCGVEYILFSGLPSSADAHRDMLLAHLRRNHPHHREEKILLDEGPNTEERFERIEIPCTCGKRLDIDVEHFTGARMGYQQAQCPECHATYEVPARALHVRPQP